MAKKNKNKDTSIVEINGVKVKMSHVIVQDINSDYPKVYIVKPYPEMTKEIYKALEDMSIYYTGMVHFGGYYGEDKIFYIYYVDHYNADKGMRSLPTNEINEAYYNVGSPKCIDISKKFAKIKS